MYCKYAKGARECFFVNAVKYTFTVSMLKVRGSVVSHHCVIKYKNTNLNTREHLWGIL